MPGHRRTVEGVNLRRVVSMVVGVVALAGCTTGPGPSAEPVLAGDPRPVFDVTGLGGECAVLAAELADIAEQFGYHELVDVDASMSVQRITAAVPKVCGEAGANRFAVGVLGPWLAAVPPTFDPVDEVSFDTSCDAHLDEVRSALDALVAAERYDNDAERAVADAINEIPFVVDPVEFVVAGEPVPDEVADHTGDGCTGTEITVFRMREELPRRRLAGLIAYNSAGDVAGNRVVPQTERAPVEVTDAEVFDVDECDTDLAQLNERVAELASSGAERSVVDAAVGALVDAETRCGLHD